MTLLAGKTLNRSGGDVPGYSSGQWPLVTPRFDPRSARWGLIVAIEAR